MYLFVTIMVSSGKGVILWVLILVIFVSVQKNKT